MAEDKKQQPAHAAPAKTGNGLVGKLLIAGFMGAVVAVECLLAYMFIPSADQVAALAEQNMTKKLPSTLAEAGLASSHGHGHDESTVEIDLGEYTITVSQPSAGTALRVDFHLAGTVLEEEETEARHFMERHPARFREIVLYEIRNSEPEDLRDPVLGLIKRRILEKSNALFGKPILKSLIFDEFSYIEQ